jgi:hypothetical protein
MRSPGTPKARRRQDGTRETDHLPAVLAVGFVRRVFFSRRFGIWVRLSRFLQPPFWHLGSFVALSATAVLAFGFVRAISGALFGFVRRRRRRNRFDRTTGCGRRTTDNGRLTNVAPPAAEDGQRTIDTGARRSRRVAGRFRAICSSEVAERPHGRNGSRPHCCRRPRSGTDRRPEQILTFWVLTLELESLASR